MPTVARRARIEGRVQGVYFRASTAQQAAALGIRGYARNLPDGAVEVLAAGSSDAVNALLDWLRHGPPLARVEAISVEPADDGDIPPGFTAR
jgi:acylphosphatase